MNLLQNCIKKLSNFTWNFKRNFWKTWEHSGNFFTKFGLYYYYYIIFHGRLNKFIPN